MTREQIKVIKITAGSIHRMVTKNIISIAEARAILKKSGLL